MDDNTNCRYCGTKITLVAQFCPQCGGPNEPEPVSFFIAVGNRFKAALKAKTESVWADRLAALMPLQFIISMITLVISLNPLNTLVLIISIVAMASVLIYYPDWYKAAPEKRKEYGLIHFLITLAQLVIVYTTMS